MFATPSFTNRIMSENNFKEIPLLMNLGWHFEFFEILQHCGCQRPSKENTGQKLYSPYPEGNQLHLAQFAMSCLSNVHFPPTTRNLFHYTPRGHPQMTSSFLGVRGVQFWGKICVLYLERSPRFAQKSVNLQSCLYVFKSGGADINRLFIYLSVLFPETPSSGGAKVPP